MGSFLRLPWCIHQPPPTSFYLALCNPYSWLLLVWCCHDYCRSSRQTQMVGAQCQTQTITEQLTTTYWSNKPVASFKKGQIIKTACFRVNVYLTKKINSEILEYKRDLFLSIISLSLLSLQSCWNCGRKASETCSGCNTARYCGSFCQHKDWEKHHHVCGQGLQGLPGGSCVPLGTPSSSSSASSSAPPTHSESTPPGPLSLVGQSSVAGGAGSGNGSVSASPKESSSSSASRSTTPATPALLDATSRWRPSPLSLPCYTELTVSTLHTKPNWGNFTPPPLKKKSSHYLTQNTLSVSFTGTDTKIPAWDSM